MPDLRLQVTFLTGVAWSEASRTLYGDVGGAGAERLGNKWLSSRCVVNRNGEHLRKRVKGKVLRSCLETITTMQVQKQLVLWEGQGYLSIRTPDATAISID